MDDPQVFWAQKWRSGSTEMGKAADETGLWQKMRSSCFGHILPT